jgi:single-strand DNA-binding protein
MFRSITIVGHLGGEPEIRDLPSGSKAANFSVATNEPFIDKDGIKQPNTEWFRVVAYQTGETGLVTGLIQKYLYKGQMVFITGTPVHRKWVDQQGNNRTSFEIKLGPQSTIKMLGGTPGPKVDNPGEPASKTNGHAPNTETGDPGFGITDAPF